MKETLQYLFEYKTLNKAQAKKALISLAEGTTNLCQMSAFMTVYMMRTITVEELEGFRDGMLELCRTVNLSEFDPIDLCGTGGDGKDTFNISTLASFVLAGAGVYVAKHGNYGVSSSVGSSNILEHFGIRFTDQESQLRKQIEVAGICIMHAPLFHPAMKHIAPVRKELGMKTFFNMLGPLVNPSFPRKQMVGVFNLELARLYAYVFQKSDKHYTIIHSLDGYDEISLTGPAKLITRASEKILLSAELGFNIWKASEITAGHTIKDSADIFENVLKNSSTRAQKEVVLANAAVGIQTAIPELDFESAKARAEESIESGKALQAFKKLLELQS